MFEARNSVVVRRLRAFTVRVGIFELLSLGFGLNIDVAAVYGCNRAVSMRYFEWDSMFVVSGSCGTRFGAVSEWR